MNRYNYLIVIVAALLMCSCGSKPANNKWMHENEVRVAIDAGFENVMLAEINAFTHKHIEAEMLPLFVREDSAIWMLMKDSVRCAIVTRKLKQDEVDYIRATHRLQTRHDLIAYDAFALIVNKANPDTVITTDEIRRIAMGEITRWEQLGNGTKKGELQMVFDQSGSSTARFMRDSLCNGKPLSGNVAQAGSNLDVVEAVRNNPDIIGVVSTDWLRDENQEAMSDFHGLDVNVMLVSRGKTALEMSKICRPYQFYIANGDYPLVRTVYVISTDPRPASMLKNFYYFLKGDGGQRLICNDSQLLPSLAVQIRDATIH